MDRETILCLVQLGLLFGTDQPHARLPQYVFRAVCPYTNDSSQWEDSSNRLYCLHDLNSTDTGNVYHCLPSSFFNETVEFCGRAITVPPGYCPIYNYTDKAGDVPGRYNCSGFVSGCPTESFLSKDVRKFPSCLNINRKHGCYIDDWNCPKTSVTQVPKETTNDVKSATFSTVSSIPTDSSPDTPTPDDRDKAIYVSPIVIVIGTCTIIGLTVSLIISLKYLYKFNSSNEELEESRPFIRDQSIHNITTTNCDASCQTEDQSIHIITKTNCDASCQTEVTKKADECASEFNEFDDFLETVERCITDKIWQSMRAILLNGILDLGYIEKLKTTRMLFELSELFTFQCNIPFLEMIFEECCEHDLVQKCKKVENKFQFKEFQKILMPSCGNEHIKFMMTKTGKESITDRVNCLRNWIGETLKVHPGRILLTSLYLQAEPIAVTFMMRDKHANYLLDHVKTDDGQIDLFHKGVIEIVHDENVFKIDKALNGRQFVQLHLSSNKIRENDIKKAALYTLQKVKQPMEGEEIYMKVFPRKEKGKEDGDESSSKRKLIKKDRDFLLENFEPMTVCDTVMTSMFDENDMMIMRNIKGRRKRAESFLEMCDKLPKEKFEMIFSSYLVKHLPSSKNVPNYEEMGPVRMRNWIQQNQVHLLDEIDSNFIKTTIITWKMYQKEI